MADTLTAKNSDAKYESHPEGQFVASCVDCIDLGDKVEDYPGTPKKLSHKCALVFRTGELNGQTGDLIDISREFTVSMGELANLRKFLEQWRGRAYSETQIEEGVPLHKLAGQWALLSISHKKSGKGRTYAVIMTVSGVPKQMQNNLPEFAEYVRADYWETRKKEYAEAAKQFRAEAGVGKRVNPDDEDFDGFTADDENDDSDLPF